MKKYLALKASAGSGKTFALTVRYITLLLLDAKPNEILTLTFTNKAANEMSERIYKTLLTLGDDDAYLNAIIQESNLKKEEILGKKNILVKSFSNANLSIFTIDKFINKILREFCGYVGISDDFEIKVDDIESLSMRFLQSLSSSQFDTLINFSIYEKKKFNSIFDLFKNLLEKNETIDIVNIDVKLINLQKDEVLQKAYKIKEFIQNCSIASASAIKAVDFTKFDELFSKTWLNKDTASEYSYFKKCANETLEAYFQEVKTEIALYYKLRAGYSLSKLFELYTMFKEFKSTFNKNKNYLEFNDISNLVYELLSSDKVNNKFLYFRLDSKFSHILMDEFQDTSLLQYKIIEPMIKEIMSGNENEFKSFFYVGDIKQSIYRFRGGKRELFDYVANDNVLLDVEVLNTNYRSSENIISFVNSLFNNLPSYEYHDQLSIRKGGYVEVLEDVALDEDEKFVNVAAKIASLIKEGVNSNDIAILTYTNADVLSMYYYLKEKFPSLKITTEMTSKLINQENVQAIINAIKYIYFKEDIYKENLNALIGNKVLSKLNLNFNLEKKSIQELIYEISTYLKIIDENVIKFIDVCSVYNNIVDFVYEVDKMDAIMENSESSGLQILTIFKSKGLEFNTVIMLDRIKRKNIDKSSLLFEYDSVNLNNIFYKIKGYENYNEEYANALIKEKKLSLEDEINILYVALTRAKNNMIIFKKIKSSVFDILNMGISKQGTIIQSINASKNYERSEKVLYTALDLGTQEKQISKEKDTDKNRLHSKYFGIATHFCLEMMDEFNLSSLDDCINIVKTRFSNFLNENDFNDIKNRITLLIQNETFSSLLENSQFISEQSLVFNGEIKILDLLLYKENKYYIFDYKTTKDKSNEHIKQVSHYKKAISEIFKTQEVYSYIVYLKQKEVLIDEV